MILVLSALLAGGGMYYLQVYGYYHEVEPMPGADVAMTTLAGGLPETILYDDFRAIDATSSPLRYRACFTTPMSQALMTETYVIYDDPVPLNAPGWFDCFDAARIGAELEEGTAVAFLGTGNIVYGFDRVVAVTESGQGYVWHQLNICGKEVFDGNPPPDGCPPAPERTE